MPNRTSTAKGPSTELQKAYNLMLTRFGSQHWWPADSPLEVCVGAILTQNTNWSNVERAITALKVAGVLTPHALYRLPRVELKTLIRPAGTYRVKAARLRAFLTVLVDGFGGNLNALFDGSTPLVRRRLLQIPGIGQETADCMLLYASSHEQFVVDAYTRRIFARHNWSKPDVGYSELQTQCSAGFSPPSGRSRLECWREAHALLVMVGKHHCRSRLANCEPCPLRPLLSSPNPEPL